MVKRLINVIGKNLFFFKIKISKFSCESQYIKMFIFHWNVHWIQNQIHLYILYANGEIVLSYWSLEGGAMTDE